MSAIDVEPRGTAHDGGEDPRAGIKPLRILARVALIHARRSPMPLIVPLIAALIWFDALRTGDSLPAIWTQRVAVLPDHVMPDLGPITAGMAAWIGGREHGRGMSDLVESTARPRWLRQLAAWGSALAWALAVYAVCVAVVFIMAARAHSWGGPTWWPVAVIGLTIALFCTVGFVAGALFPSRFTAPLAALGSFFGAVMLFQSAVNATSGWTLLSPDNQVPYLGWGVFHPYPPDLSIVQMAFLFGAIVALLGAMGVSGAVRGAQLRRAALGVTGVGAAVCAVAFGFATTATMGAYGYVVPALHDAANNQPLAYTPICTRRSAVPVCAHPAFPSALPVASTAFDPLLAVVAGLPGAPVSVMQIDAQDLPGGEFAGRQAPTIGSHLTSAAGLYSTYGAGVELNTVAAGGPVLEYGFDDEYGFTDPQGILSQRTQAAVIVIEYLVAPHGNPGPAQRAVEAALYQATGIPLTNGSSTGTAGSSGHHVGADPGIEVPGPTPGSAVQIAAQRFAALSATERHAWLTANLGRLSSGQTTLEELP
jgi:hypothetical protein